MYSTTLDVLLLLLQVLLCCCCVVAVALLGNNALNVVKQNSHGGPARTDEVWVDTIMVGPQPEAMEELL